MTNNRKTEYPPLIGITCRQHAIKNYHFLRPNYAQAITDHGATPVLIPLLNDPSYLSHILMHLDGICLSGSGNDINPMRFNQSPIPQLGDIDPLRESVDLSLLALAENKGLPILGICYGCQILNVSRSGSLIQDISIQTQSSIYHQEKSDTQPSTHGIKLSSPFSQWINADETHVNSSHHQAIDQPGKFLTPIAWATDGIIEAVYDPRPDRWVYGVQWHPEIDAISSPLSSALWKNFVNAASEFQKKEMTPPHPSA